MKLERTRQQEQARIRAEDEKREKEANEKIESAMRRLAALAILSALCDGIGFVNAMSEGLQKIMHGGVLWTALECVCSIVICMLVIYVGKQAVAPMIREEKQHLAEWREKKRKK